MSGSLHSHVLFVANRRLVDPRAQTASNPLNPSAQQELPNAVRKCLPVIGLILHFCPALAECRVVIGFNSFDGVPEHPTGLLLAYFDAKEEALSYFLGIDIWGDGILQLLRLLSLVPVFHQRHKKCNAPRNQ